MSRYNLRINLFELRNRLGGHSKKNPRSILDTKDQVSTTVVAERSEVPIVVGERRKVELLFELKLLTFSMIDATFFVDAQELTNQPLIDHIKSPVT